MRLELIGLEGLPEVRAGTDLAALLSEAAQAQDTPLARGDILVVTQKIVSKAEGRTVDLAAVTPSPFARAWAEEHGTDARLVELVLRESRRIVRMDHGVIIAETRQGHVCANAGVDVSNVDGGRTATLLPENANRSAARLRTELQQHFGCAVGVVICDTFGRAWRMGQVNVAIGVAGFHPLVDYAGATDPYGYRMRASAHAIADEVAAAAGLVCGKLIEIPAVIIRGFRFTTDDSASAAALARPPHQDMFR